MQMQTDDSGRQERRDVDVEAREAIEIIPEGGQGRRGVEQDGHKVGQGRRKVEQGRRKACPYCGSTSTELFSLFGQQLLTVQLYCHDCHTPFECVKDDELLDASSLGE